MGETWMGIVIGAFAPVIAAPAAVSHYRREHHPAQLLGNLDHRD